MAILKTIKTGELQLIDKDSFRDKQIIQRTKDNILIEKMICKIDQCTKELRKIK